MIVDTSVWVNYFNSNKSWQADRLRNAIEENETIVLPGIVLTEILLGFSTDKEAEKVSALLEAFEVSPELTTGDYKQAAAIYRKCRRQGKTIRSTVDCLIAVICIRDGLALLSKDRDFDFISESYPLKCITP